MKERVEAALCYMNTARTAEQQRKLELHAFMSIFHPEVAPEKVREMVRGK